MSNIKVQAISLGRIVLGFSNAECATAFQALAQKKPDLLWGSSIIPSSAYDKPWTTPDGKLLKFDYDPTKNNFIAELTDLIRELLDAAVRDLKIWAEETLGLVLKDADEGSIFFGLNR